MTIGVTGWQVSQDGTTYQDSILLNTEGTHSLTLHFKNAEGQITNSISETVKIDKAAPTGIITVKESQFKSFVNTITFGLLCKETINVNITADADNGSPVTIAYYKVSNPTAALTAEQLNGLAADSWKSQDSFSVTEDEKFETYARLTDAAGHVT